MWRTSAPQPRVIDELIEQAKACADLLDGFQSVAEIGLGDTADDLFAAGFIYASAHEVRDENGRLTPARMYDTNGLARWYRGGLPRIRLSHGLAAQLALTDPTGIEAADVCMPFRCYMLEFPFPQGPVVLDDGKEDAVAMLVMDYRLPCDPVEFGVGAKSLAELLALLVKQRGESQWIHRNIHGLLYAGSSALEIAVPLRRAIAFPSAAPGIPDRDRRAGLLAQRIVVNLALYVKHVDSLGGSTGTGGKAVNHDHDLTSMLYEVGTEVKLERPLRDAARAFCMRGQAHKKWKLDKRFIVRGHWKKQACGKERTERKLVFVEPYWKGPMGAPVVARLYTGGEE